MKRILLVLLMLFLAIPAIADQQKPGKGIKVQPARATWNTGYFQEALVSAGLKELGYNVQKPKELANPLFYQSLALGDLDYWTNGWFPVHDGQLPKNFYDKGEKSVMSLNPVVCKATWYQKEMWKNTTFNHLKTSSVPKSRKPLMPTATVKLT